ncbi:MAG: glutamate-5-semialdehyde dehydrogenase [Edaphocola sp.]
MEKNTQNTWKSAVAKASRELNLVSEERKQEVLLALANSIPAAAASMLASNNMDLARMDIQNPMYDRLLLSEERLQSIADDLRNVAHLPSPLGKILERTERPNGMLIQKVAVSFGVIGIIYEARPNVTFDVFALCFKSGNVCVLKGGSDAHESNTAIVGLIKSVLQSFGLNEDFITLLPAGREATADLMDAVGTVDVIIPRGGKGLIEYVRNNSRVPVIETGAGVCHTYFDKEGDRAKGSAIVFNAKTRRVSVCNALDCLVIHKDRLACLPELASDLATKNVLIYADGPALSILKGHYPSELLRPATDESYGTEFLSYTMSIKTVNDTNEAIDHIAAFGSRHSECIVTENADTAAYFAKRVDAACVYTNVSTAFTDGAQFGLGAEIGISTQKLHARGPMALAELCSYKWIITGNGQVRG